MSRLGKSFKNRFLRRALALVLAGTMVMSGMPVSAAAEPSDADTLVEAEVQGRTEDVSEEAAEEEEVAQRESGGTEEKETESTEPAEETKSVSEKESTAEKGDHETNTASADSKETTAYSEVEETEVSETETDAEEASENEVSEDAENQYTSSDALLKGDHKNAKWGIDGTIASSNNKLEDSSGTYTNAAEDVLFINADSGKFYPDTSRGRIQIKTGTKIYIPVKTDNNGKAKIIIYQSSITNSDNVIYTKDSTQKSFKILKDETALSDSDVTCTSFVKKGSYYQTELTMALGSSNASAVICVEAMGSGDIYASKIISGEEVRDDVYDADYENSAELVKYNMEGYAASAKVTGGGVIKEETENYYTVDDADSFITALSEIKTNAEPAVIKIEGDLNLGCNEFKNDISQYDTNLIKAHTNQPLMHPTLKDTGISMLTLDGFTDLTIFSENGAAVKHCCIVLKNSENIVFRNLVFDELWEWDDLVYYKADSNGDPDLDENEELQLTEGDYDRNDWDYICVDSNSDGVWIDHCTFYKSYDGVIDIKNPKTGVEGNEAERVTISWCKFEEKSEPKVVDGKTTYPFYDAQIQWLKENVDSTDYYRALMAEEGTNVDIKATNGKTFTTDKTGTIKGEGFSDSLIESYTRGQKKTHLLGQGDSSTNAVGIRATFANNIYKNSMDRMPRLRFGNAHMYNAVLDASDIYYAHRLAGGDDDEAKAERKKLDGHLVSNGAISTKDGNVFLDTCYINGIEGAILSGNGSSTPGYIGWENCKYKLGDSITDLKIEYKNNTGNLDFSLSKADFEDKLPKDYKYNLYDGELDNLESYLSNNAGAGVVNMSAVQWTKTSYGNDSTGEGPDVSESTETDESSSAPESTETDESSSVPESTETDESSSAPESTETEGSSDTEETSDTEESSEEPESTKAG